MKFFLDIENLMQKVQMSERLVRGPSAQWERVVLWLTFKRASLFGRPKVHVDVSDIQMS